MIEVQVRLFAHFTRNVSQAVREANPEGIRAGRAFSVLMREGSTVGELADELAIPRSEIKVTFVNGRARELNHKLQQGDQVGVFPPVGGG